MTKSIIDRVLERFISVNQKYWRLFVCASIALTIAGFYYAKHIELDTDLSRLLPQDSEAVINLKVIQQKAGGSNDLRLVLEGGHLKIGLKQQLLFQRSFLKSPNLFDRQNLELQNHS